MDSEPVRHTPDHIGGRPGFDGIDASIKHVAFHGAAANLAPDDTNHEGDVFMRDRGCAFANYVDCTPTTNRAGYTPAIGSHGTPSASAGSGFSVTASHVLNDKRGPVCDALNGQHAAPFESGTLCVKLPLERCVPELRRQRAAEQHALDRRTSFRDLSAVVGWTRGAARGMIARNRRSACRIVVNSWEPWRIPPPFR